MCLKPMTVPDIPEDTGQIARAIFVKGNRYLTLRDQLGTFYVDDQFEALFEQRGQPRRVPGV